MTNIRVSNRQPDAGYTPFGRGFVLPGRYSVFIDDPQFDYVVQMDVEVMDGAPRCRTLKATSRSDGPSVTGEGIRKLPVAGFLRHTAQDAALRIVRQAADGSVAMVPVRSEDVDDLFKDLRRTARRNTAVDTDRLKDVADTYRTALANGEPQHGQWLTSRASPPRPRPSWFGRHATLACYRKPLEERHRG